jgi:hypothetical protein
MGATPRLVDKKFYDQLNNGDDFNQNLTSFATHLKGGVTERLKAVFTIQIDWFSYQSTFSIIIDNGAGTVKITDNTANYQNDGIQVGDSVKWSINDGTASRQYTGVVTSITGGEIVLGSLILTQGGIISDGIHSYTSKDSYITGLTDITSLKYKFGLIENNESFNTLSKLTNTDQLYSYNNIDHAIPLTYSTGVAMGINKAWVTGSSQVAFSQLVLDKDLIYNQATTQEFIIEHIFEINPLYRDGEIDSLKGIDVPPLDIFNGNLSLKYVLETEFRTVVNNPNTSKTAQIDTLEGSVGYLGESFNGFPNDFSVSDLVYFNITDSIALTKIDVDKTTQVTFSINSPNGLINASTPLVVGHSAIVDSLKYANSTDDYDTVWTNETARTLEGAAPYAGAIIKNYTCTRISSNKLDVSFELSYSTNQKALITDGQDYALTYVIQDSSKDVDNGGKSVDKIDINTYSKSTDIDGLFEPVIFDQYPHPEVFTKGVTQGFSSGKLFIEDGQMSDCEFKILNEYNGANVSLDSLIFKIVAYNNVTNEWFDLRSLQIDLSNQVQVGNIQNIILNSDRGYILEDADIFNYLNISTEANDGTWQTYSLQVGYKTPWQDWIELIGADTIFYDPTENFNGLNNNSSNYTFSNDYKLRLVIDANVTTGNITTNYITKTGEFEAYGYSKDDLTPDGYTADIKTFDVNGNALAGNIIQASPTEFRATFTPSSTNQPVFTVNVDFTEVDTLWNRFAHGNKLIGTQPRAGTWENEQANDTDTFSDGVSAFVKGDVSLYTSTPSQILTNQNCNAFYGVYSLEEYEFYQIKGDMFSNDPDNDALSYVIAHNVDDLGVEHTISLCATTGGVLLDISPDYIGDDTQSTMKFLIPQQAANWALVYDFGKSGCEQLLLSTTTKSGFLWDDALVGDFNFDVIRTANTMVIDCTWTIDGVLFTDIFNFDLNSNIVTEQFIGVKPIGFGFMSQTSGGFKNVELINPLIDYYSILRIEEINSQSDLSIYELSTIIEAPANNLLTQISGVEKKAKLSWVSGSFITQGVIDSSMINTGAEYKLSAELRSVNLTDSYPLLDSFNVVVDTSLGNGLNSFAMPLIGVFGSVFIDWGDGATNNISSHTDPRLDHDYDIGGEYTIKIWGAYEWAFSNTGDKSKITEVTQLGNFQLIGSDFWGCDNLTGFPISESIKIRGSSILYSFRDTVNLTVLDMSGTDTSAVTEMIATFRNSGLEYVDTTSWDMANITSMSDFGIISSFTPAFYGELLQSLSSQSPLIASVALGMGAIKYPISNQGDRDILTNTPNSWVITDGGSI